MDPLTATMHVWWPKVTHKYLVLILNTLSHHVVKMTSLLMLLAFATHYDLDII
jgi:hypothetical protein